MMRLTTLIMAAIIAGGALAGTMYEWRDPDTGSLKAGDRPPTGGIEYWTEGNRPAPKAQPPIQPLETAPTKPTPAPVARPAPASKLPANEAVQILIRAAGYRCDSVDQITPFLLSHGYSVFCNKLRYHYELEDRGGRIIVTVQ